jgi:hypothetical protein
MNSIIHTYNNGATLHKIKVRELLKIPIWKGNRILDLAHVAEIQKAIGPNIKHLDSGYHIIEYEELDATNTPVLQSYIIDGQHRAAVLMEHFNSTLCESEFDVLVTKKRVIDEEEAITFFNAINKSKPQAWKIDPALLVNKYIAALTKRFNKDKKMLLIRSGATHRPYLSTDKLREAMLKYAERLKQTSKEIGEFVDRVTKWNIQEQGVADMSLMLQSVNKKDIALLEKSKDLGFLLAFDPSFKWIETCLE